LNSHHGIIDEDRLAQKGRKKGLKVYHIKQFEKKRGRRNAKRLCVYKLGRVERVT